MRYKLEVNLSRHGGEPAWHYLMEDEFSSCEFETEAEARAVMAAEERGDCIRLIEFTGNGIGRAKK